MRDRAVRLCGFRLAKGWTQEELAERSGVALSSLKLFEAKGQGSLQRLVRVAVALGVDGELRGLFARPHGDGIHRSGQTPRTATRAAPEAERSRQWSLKSLVEQINDFFAGTRGGKNSFLSQGFAIVGQSA